MNELTETVVICCTMIMCAFIIVGCFTFMILESIKRFKNDQIDREERKIRIEEIKKRKGYE